MPTGPNGEKRPADTNACAVLVAKIATGEIEEKIDKRRNGGLKGGPARAEKLSPERRSEIARKAIAERWNGASGGD
ncbi:MAG: RNA-binding protein [Chloroflexi bacterium]|nr:RNA-binding protein [Chloroflexota bacterium]